MSQSRVTLEQLLFAVLVSFFVLGFLSCSKREPPAPAKAEAPQPAVSAPPPLAQASLIPPEGVSEASAEAPNSKLVLPVSVERRTGDLDVMLKKRKLRALVLLDPFSFFYDNGKPHGLALRSLTNLSVMSTRSTRLARSRWK